MLLVASMLNFCGLSWGRISAQSKAANPRAHANFRKNVTYGFKSGFDTAIGKSATNAADPVKNDCKTMSFNMFVAKQLKIIISVPMS